MLKIWSDWVISWIDEMEKWNGEDSAFRRGLTAAGDKMESAARIKYFEEVRK